MNCKGSSPWRKETGPFYLSFHCLQEEGIFKVLNSVHTQWISHWGEGFHTQTASDPNSPCASGAEAQADCSEGEVATEPGCVHFLCQSWLASSRVGLLTVLLPI